MHHKQHYFLVPVLYLLFTGLHFIVIQVFAVSFLKTFYDTKWGPCKYWITETKTKIKKATGSSFQKAVSACIASPTSLLRPLLTSQPQEPGPAALPSGSAPQGSENALQENRAPGGGKPGGRAGATGEQAVRVALQKQPGGRSLCRPLPPVLLSQTMSRPSHVPHHLIFLHPLLPPIIVTPAGVMTLRRKSHATCLWKACLWLAVRLGMKPKHFFLRWF